MSRPGAVSVIIPCYRSTETIAMALASVAAQTARPAEVIVVDDFSNDAGHTLALLDALCAHWRDTMPLRVLALPVNLGPGEARNAGWNIATGQYIAFLDADDTWHPQKLAIQAHWMDTHPHCTLSCHGTEQVEAASPPPARLEAAVAARPLALTPMLYRNRIATRSVMLRREIRERFPVGIRYAEDYHLWLRILANSGRAYKLSARLAFSYKADFGASGLSSNLPAMHHGVLRCFSDLRETGLLRPWQYASACAFEFLKYWRRRLVTSWR